MVIGKDSKSGVYSFEITSSQYKRLLKGQTVEKITGNREHGLVKFTLKYEVIA